MVENVTNLEIVDTIKEALLVLREDMTVEYASRNFYRTFEVDEKETIGRKLHDLGDGQWDIPDLRKVLLEVIPVDNSIEGFIVEHEFPNIGRRVMHINARRTHIAGNGSKRLLMAIEDITRSYDIERELGRQRRLAQGIVDTVRDNLLVLDGDLRIVTASRSFCKTFEVSVDEISGMRLDELGNGQWNIPHLKDLLGKIIPDNETVEDFLVEHEFENLGYRKMLLNARKIFREGNNTKAFLLSIEDVTEKYRIEEDRKEAVDRSQALLQELNHRVMNSLTVIGSIMALEARNMTDDQCKAAFERIRNRVQAVGELYRTLMSQDVIDNVLADDYLGAIASDVLKSIGSAGGQNIVLEKDILQVPLSTQVAVPLGLVLNELTTNSIKYAFDGYHASTPTIRVSLSQHGDSYRLSVSDNGKGYDREQASDSGVGSRIVSTFATQLDGEIDQESGDAGTRTDFTFPADR